MRLEAQIRLSELVSQIESAQITGDPDLEIAQVEYDSRMVKGDCLFVAIKGYQRDGYDFVEDAVKRGAVAVLGEREGCEAVEHHVQVDDARQALAEVAARFYGYPGKNIKACGVTGTNGKTTTAHLIQNILRARNKTTGLVSSVVYDTGKETFAAERTTPESLDLQRLLFLMKKNYCVNAVLEVSSHALVLHRVDQINFRVAVYTNITRDHLDFHESMEDYLEAKKLLLKRLDGPLNYAVINLDVPEFRPLFGDFNSSYIAYSLENESADVYCASYEIKPDHTVFDLVTPMGTRTVHFPLPGGFNLRNALAAAAAGLGAGVDVDTVIRGLESAAPVPGRFEPIVQGQPFGVFIDFAHTPDAITRLCESARELCKEGKLLLLLGCGGDRDKGKRPLMAEAAAAGADFCVVTSDNPRSEDPASIIEDMKPGLKGSDHEIIIDRKEAIAAILKRASDGDVVLLAGKGAEPYMEVKGERYPFSDAQEAKGVLAEMGYRETTSGREN
jgi:UDP-N-acetylmuramoyl-L-alanyl-D-glutamate--2,6-diaminopimelate ligase